MRNLLAYLLIALGIATAIAFVNPRKAVFNRPDRRDTEVTFEMIEKWSAQVLWVDARDEVEFQKDRIPKALLLNADCFEKNIVEVLNEWTPDSKVVVYCDSELCDNSREIADKLRTEIGLPEVYELYGGWDAWIEHRK